MKIKVVTDSSSNLYSLGDIDFASVPLKIIAGEEEYVDDEQLDVSVMIEELSTYKGKSGTSCPNMAEWLAAFGDADLVLGASLTSKISGCFNAAHMAAEEYTEMYPDRRVFILDSLSTGPELELLIERYSDLIHRGSSFEQIIEGIKTYLNRTHLMFSLESLQNFVNNGRVSPVVAAAARVFGICIVGQASAEGELQPLHKCQGRTRAIKQIWKCMQEAGYLGGKVRIRHTFNEKSARLLETEIHSVYPAADIRIGNNHGLCSYYAETGGILVGFESGVAV